MASKDNDEKDRGSEDKSAASAADKESRQTAGNDSDEGQLTAVKPKRGEPADNLRRRADWFQKRH